MTSQHERQVPRLLTSLVVTVLAIVEAGAVEPASPPAGAPLAVDQHGPTIKGAYKDHLLIGMAGDLPGNHSDQELGLVKEISDYASLGLKVSITELDVTFLKFDQSRN